MKYKFPILFKVILLGTAVSIIAAGVSVAVSYNNQVNRSKKTLIDNIDNTLDQVAYLYEDGPNAEELHDNIKAIISYVDEQYQLDPDISLDDFDSFDEYEATMKDKYPWIFPNGSILGTSKDSLDFKARYVQLSSILIDSKISSNVRAAYVSYTDTKRNRLVFIDDSRIMNGNTDEKDHFYHLPGSHYDLTNADVIIDKEDEKYYGYELYNYSTRYYPITEKIDGKEIEIAKIFLEYDIEPIMAQSRSILGTEIAVLAITGGALVVVYALSAYFLFVKNINKLSKASGEIATSLANKEELITHNINIKSHDEIKNLADSFTTMENEIINYVGIIKEETQYKERAAAELAVASKIQLASLPDPSYDDSLISLRSFIKTAKEVGGDFYDYFYLDNFHLAFIISDVSGKGVPASLFMMKSKELIKSKLLNGNSLEVSIKHANDSLAKNNKENLFVTSFIGIIDTQTHMLEYINAGHEKPYIISGKEIIKMDGTSNFVLGGEEGYEYKKETRQLNEGDIIFLFTDGLNESIDEDENEFGYERIISSLNESISLSLDDKINYINNKLEEFTNYHEGFDDVTMMLVKIQKNNLTLEYDKKDYSIIEDAVNQFSLYYKDINSTVKSQFGIIIDELLNNLISYEKREDLKITLKFSYKNDKFSLKIISNGDDYNPFTNNKEKYFENEENELEEGGFGIILVKELSDYTNYEYVDNQSIVTIEKKVI